MRKQILIVGRQPDLEQEFRAYAEAPDSRWSATAAPTVPEALSLLAQQDFAAVVAEVESAESRSVALLNEITRRQPHILRLVISDPADTRATLKCIGQGHHHLLKPCGVAQILETLETPYRSENWRPSETAQELIGKMHHLPSPPKVYFQILTELQSPDVWVERIGELIAQDPAVTAKVLQLANSAMFGLQIQVTHPRDAVAYIGLETTKALVLLAHTFSSFGGLAVSGFSADELWRHSVVVGRFAKRIARLESRESALADQAFTAGLLHDIGKLLLAENRSDLFGQALRRVRDEGGNVCAVEEQLVGASHAELGACLLGTWGLPRPIVEAVALHHTPSRTVDRTFNTLTAVHAANALAHEAWPTPTNTPSSPMDPDYLQLLNLEERSAVWREHCLEADPKGNA
jgi:putative nucleotidyltransferase with HDIG domain